MELKLDIRINQLIGLIRQLPSEQKLRIKKELEKEIKKKSIPEHEDLKELLLAGPVMTEEEEENFNNFDNAFNKWTKSLFA